MEKVLMLGLILTMLGVCGQTDDLQGTSSSGSQGKVDDLVWDRVLVVANVEKACLQVAKGQAAGAAWAVKGCTCTESADSERKRYACSVSTMDPSNPAIPVTMDCVRAERVCRLESAQGNMILEFDAIAAAYGAD